MQLPKARTENLLEQNFKDETLIYDLTINKAFNLNETSTIVYKACGQNKTFDELRRKHKFTDDFIYLALDELKRSNLLAGVYDSPFASTNRRDVIKKIGLASMMVLPIITGLVAPKAINAASGVVDSSGGSNRPGFYNQECLHDPRNPNYCLVELVCASVRGGGMRCCKNGGGNPGAGYLLPGDSIVDRNLSPVYYPVNSPPTSGVNNCGAGSANCCDGSAPSGTCTIEPDTINEYGPADYEGFEKSGYYPYIQTCTCSC